MAVLASLSYPSLVFCSVRKLGASTFASFGGGGSLWCWPGSVGCGVCRLMTLQNAVGFCFFCGRNRHRGEGTERSAAVSLRMGCVLSGYRSELWVRKRRRRKAGLSAAGNSELNPVGDEGYWDKPEGKELLNEIEDMNELIAEAEKLQNAGAERRSEVSASASSIQASEEEQAQKLREELAKCAREQSERRKQAEKMFHMGQRTYGRGMYDKSVEFFEAALTNIPGVSNLGGEIQIWLAMAYEAHNRHNDCIKLYKILEKTHPNKAIRRQATDLRYILEAPKLKISKEEMVTIPIIGQNNDRYFVIVCASCLVPAFKCLYCECFFVLNLIIHYPKAGEWIAASF
eukprot:c21003_g1_i2 orf=222-1253(+)